MSRKNKTLRAFLHQTRNPTIEQAWDAAWKHAQKTFHARSMQDMEERLADTQAECERLARYYKNGIDCFANPCEEHSGERTPPFPEFFEKYGGQCLICVVDNNKALKAERDAAFALLRECQLILREERGERIDYVELNAFLEGNASAMDILAACGQGGDV